MPYLNLENAPEVLDALNIVWEHSTLGQRTINACLEIGQTTILQNQEVMLEMGHCNYDEFGNITITVANTNDIRVNTHILPHELMHAVQLSRTFRQVDRLKGTLNGKDRAKMSLALEAAAETFAIHVSHDIRQSTMTDEYWCPPAPSYEPLFDVFDRTYQAERKRGISHNSAIQKACDVTYQEYFQTQSLLDLYNELSLGHYLSRTVGSSSPRHVSETLTNSFAVDTTDLQTSVFRNREPLITSPTLPDSDSAVFGSNSDMRQAFEYVDFFRSLRLYSDPQHPQITEGLASLKKDFNKFLGISLSQAGEEVKQSGAHYALQTMNRMASAYQTRHIPPFTVY